MLELLGMDAALSPGGKVARVRRACRHVLALCGAPASADDLLPALIFTVSLLFLLFHAYYWYFQNNRQLKVSLPLFVLKSNFSAFLSTRCTRVSAKLG